MHGPLLKRAAAKNSLWGRVLSGLSSAAPDQAAGRGAHPPSAAGGSPPTQEASPAQLLIQQAAHSYRAQSQQQVRAPWDR